MRELSTARFESAHASRSGRPSGPAWYAAGLAFSLLMLVVHAAAGLHTAGVPDFWRDIYWATKIAHGEALPLVGPPIYGLVELGPWWFYLLALPVKLFGRVAAAAVFVQLLAGLKYLLAWRLGTRLVDARFGLAFAVALAMAGWSTIPVMFPSHTALVETTLLLLAMATWRCWQRFSITNALLFGLAAGACITAHPTTVSYVAIAGGVLIARDFSWATAARLALAVVVVVAMLAPPLFDHAPHTAARSIDAYVGSDVGAGAWQRAPALLASAVVGGAWNGFLLMTGWSPATVLGMWFLYCACLLVAATGLLLLPRHASALRTAAVAAGALFVVQAVFLAVLRPITPMWMLSSLLPPLAVLIGIGWYGGFTSDKPAFRIVAGVAFAAIGLLSLAPFGLYLHNAHSMRVASGVNPYQNVIEASDRFVETPVPYFSVRRQDRLARSLCEPAVLHGRLAWIAEQSLASPERLACGQWPALRFGGRDGPPRHIAGLFARAASASGIGPDRVVAGVALYERVTPIAPASGGTLTQLRRDQIHADRAPDIAAPIAIEFDSAGADVAVLTNRFPGAMPLTVRAVSSDGRAARVLYDDGGSVVYACAACDGAARVHWRFDLEGVENDLDLVSISGTVASAESK